MANSDDDLNIKLDLTSTGGGYSYKPSEPFELYKEGDKKNKDSVFMSGIISELFDIAGVVCYVYLYEGVFDQTRDDISAESIFKDLMNFDENEADIMAVQDSILGENRDRKYSDNAVRLKGIYAVSENELDFARFGTMLSNDIIQMEFHKEVMETQLGRRLIPGDVIELAHLRETGIDGRTSNRFYKVDNLTRVPGSYDAMYTYHVMAATLTPVKDAQEFIDIMERKDQYGKTLSEQAGSRDRQMQTTAQVQFAANEHAYTTWWDGTALHVNEEGKVVPQPWADDLKPPNGQQALKTSAFPENPEEGDYVVRIDFFPNKLYRFENNSWVLKEVDSKREWQPYNWLPVLREHMSDRSYVDDIRPWELKSVHDIRTPRQNQSRPSPKGDERYIHAVLQDWDRLIPVDHIPALEGDIVSRIADLVPTNTPLSISHHLNAGAGQYLLFTLRYVITRGDDQQTGEIHIVDSGSELEFSISVINTGNVGIEFDVRYNDDIRELVYTLTPGPNATMTYIVDGRFNGNIEEVIISPPPDEIPENALMLGGQVLTLDDEELVLGDTP